MTGVHLRGFPLASPALRDIQEYSDSHLVVQDTPKATEKLGARGAQSGHSGSRGPVRRGFRNVQRIYGPRVGGSIPSLAIAQAIVTQRFTVAVSFFAHPNRQPGDLLDYRKD
jgi:hypothetical protein